jgi:ArsR family transcriptional regulator, repressor of sdpIR and other operons
MAKAKPRALREVECADAVFAALAHPARRQILLSVHYRGSCKAGEIASRFECSWPTTSRHLATLVECGLLDVESVGRERIYRANDELVRDVLQTWTGYFEPGRDRS